MEAYLRAMLRDVDSSLLEEWERMRDPSYVPAERESRGLELKPPALEEDPDITRDRRSFTAAIRARIFSFLRAWSIGDDEGALSLVPGSHLDTGAPWDPDGLRVAREAHRLEHRDLRLDPEARNLRHTHVAVVADTSSWQVDQMLVDTESLNDWVASFAVDLAASREAGEPVARLVRLGPYA